MRRPSPARDGTYASHAYASFARRPKYDATTSAAAIIKNIAGRADSAVVPRKSIPGM